MKDFFLPKMKEVQERSRGGEWGSNITNFGKTFKTWENERTKIEKKGSAEKEEQELIAYFGSLPSMTTVCTAACFWRRPLSAVTTTYCSLGPPTRMSFALGGDWCLLHSCFLSITHSRKMLFTQNPSCNFFFLFPFFLVS